MGEGYLKAKATVNEIIIRSGSNGIELRDILTDTGLDEAYAFDIIDELDSECKIIIEGDTYKCKSTFEDVSVHDRAIMVFNEWDSARLVEKHGRGYYESGSNPAILDYEKMWVPGFNLLQKITELRGPFQWKMEMLDYLLAHMPQEWEAENRALFAASVIRYMAHLD